MNSGAIWLRSLYRFSVLSLLLIFGLVSSGAAKGEPQSSYASSAFTTGSGLDLIPSNPLAMPGSTGGLTRGADSAYLTSGMFRDLLAPINNLEVGYFWDFGHSRESSSRLTLDYLHPVGLGGDTVLFGQAHWEFANFWNTLKSIFRSRDYGTTVVNRQTHQTYYDNKKYHIPATDRLDLSVGAGCRRMLGNDLLIGINAFYDSSRLTGQWYSSGSLGLEMAALISGQDAVDLNLNWYGNLFSRTDLINAFRRGPNNFDLEAGYSHELYDGGPDMRLNVNAYKFSVGTPVYGWNAGAELKSRNGMFSVKYETGRDRINSRYHTIGGSVSVGLQLERLLYLESPFVMPEPIFQSPRNLKYMLTGKVVRKFSQPAAMVISRRSRTYRVGDRAYSTQTRQAPAAGIYRRNDVGSVPSWLTNLTPPSPPGDIMFLTANIARSEIDPAGVGHVDVTMFHIDSPPKSCWTWITFFDTSNTAITTTPRVISPPIPTNNGSLTYRVDLTPANMSALAQPGLDIGAIGIQVRSHTGLHDWEVRSASPALIFLNE